MGLDKTKLNNRMRSYMKKKRAEGKFITKHTPEQVERMRVRSRLLRFIEQYDIQIDQKYYVWFWKQLSYKDYPINEEEKKEFTERFINVFPDYSIKYGYVKALSIENLLEHSMGKSTRRLKKRKRNQMTYNDGTKPVLIEMKVK